MVLKLEAALGIASSLILPDRVGWLPQHMLLLVTFANPQFWEESGCEGKRISLPLGSLEA